MEVDAEVDAEVDSEVDVASVSVVVAKEETASDKDLSVRNLSIQ